MKQKCLQDHCGPYLSLVTEYLEGPAKRAYADVGGVRKQIAPFFRYVAAQGNLSLTEVTPATITSFKAWACQNGYVSASNDTSALSTFFQWLIYEERYEGESPVVPSIHGRKKVARSGRPYTSQEIGQIREWLEERGNERLRAFFEMALESGMRKTELYRVRLPDLFIDKQTLRVGLPNKTMRERQAFFADRASARILEWLTVRKADCGHDFLFHNSNGDPLRWNTTMEEFKRVLCKIYRGRMMHETGLDSFSIHRLRHTLSSNLASNGADANTLMTVLGWASASSVDVYTRISEDAKVRGFVVAMDKVEQQCDEGIGKQVLTLEEFLLLNIEEAA
jgi:site-specific recombinase XerD